MYLHMLNGEQQEIFLKLAVLVKISDDEILWDGKSVDEVTSSTDLTKLSFVESKEEREVLNRYLKTLTKITQSQGGLAVAAALTGGFISGRGSKAFDLESSSSRLEVKLESIVSDIKQEFIDEISNTPLHKQNTSEPRIFVSSKLAEKIISEIIINEPSVSKIMITELYTLVLADGRVSDIEEAVITKICELFEIEDYIKDELLTAAEELNTQVVKTLSLILE